MGREFSLCRESEEEVKEGWEKEGRWGFPVCAGVNRGSSQTVLSNSFVAIIKAGNLMAVEAKVDTMKEHCLLAGSPWLVRPAFLHSPRPPAQACPWPQGWKHSHMDDSSRKCPTELPTGQSDAGIF